MNDHNLDDLIIDNINPKNSKTKSLLTIIALAIIVLIVAIILTKTLLKEPNDTLAIHAENDTEMISPDLTLQNAIKEEVIQEKLSLDTDRKSKIEAISSLETKSTSTKEVLSKSEMIDTPKEEPKKAKIVKAKIIEETKPKTVVISQDIFDDELETDSRTEEKAKQLALEKTKKATEKKKLAAQKKAKQKAPASKIKTTQKPKTKTKAKTKKPSTTAKKIGRYYIQVGSFRQSPSKQFLSIIKKSGFNYKITPPSSSGTKKLLIGPYSSRGSVDTALPRVRDRINKSAFVVKK